MVKKMKSIMAGLCCAALLTPLAACGGSGSSDNTLDYITGAGTGTPQYEALKTLTDKFEKENPGVKINLITGTANLEQDIKVRLAGRNAPDMWNTHGWSRDRYADFLEPLQDRSWAKDMKSLGDDVFKTDDGAFYALPFDIQTTGILYNADVLEKAGVDPKSITSWDAFKDAAEKIKASGATPIAAGAKETSTAGNIADFILPGFYTDAQEKTLDGGKFDKAVYKKSTDMVEQWAKAGYFNKDYTSATLDDVYKLLAAGDAAFFFWGNGGVTNIESYNKDVKMGVIPIPGETRDPYFNAGEDWAIGVSKTSKHKDIALKYVDFLAEPENYKVINTVTSNDSALEGIDSNIGQVADTYNYWIDEQKTQTVPYFDRIHLPNGMYTTLSKSTDGLITGQLTPQAAADQVKTSFDSLYGQKS